MNGAGLRVDECPKDVSAACVQMTHPDGTVSVTAKLERMTHPNGGQINDSLSLNIAQDSVGKGHKFFIRERQRRVKFWKCPDRCGDFG